jgi:hypothetical protein
MSCSRGTATGHIQTSFDGDGIATITCVLPATPAPTPVEVEPNDTPALAQLVERNTFELTGALVPGEIDVDWYRVLGTDVVASVSGAGIVFTVYELVDGSPTVVVKDGNPLDGRRFASGVNCAGNLCLIRVWTTEAHPPVVDGYTLTIQ